MEKPSPTSGELKRWLDDTLRHCCMVEYYLHVLDIGKDDVQRPHDIVGKGNKFTWEVMSGLAMHYRDDSPEFFDDYVLPSIERHRRFQHHHQMWNQYNPRATQDDMKLGAVDAICSHLDDRPYQGGSRSLDDVISVIRQNQPHQVKWFWMVYSLIRKAPRPDVNGISCASIPNIGIPDATHAHIKRRAAQAVRMLRKRGYDC